jgi:hypothetical protein
MSSFLGSSSAASPSGMQQSYILLLDIIFIHVVDMAARKDAMKNSVRQELALANAQELMNVRGSSFIPCP